jgi:hypothetical protein
MSEGVLYVATGNQFVQEAELAVETLSREMPQLSSAIVTDRKTNPSGFDTVIRLANPSYGFEDKIKGINKSPYDKTVLLDTDTYVVESFSEIFKLLSSFDIAVTHNQNRDIYTSNIGVPRCFPEYSSGVIGFNKITTKILFDSWMQLYETDHNGDQPSFRKALYESDIRIATLPREYNYSVRTPAHIIKDVKIFHGRLFDFESSGASQYYTIQDSTQRVNEDQGHRLLAMGGYRRNIHPPLRHRIRKSIENRGIIGTILRIGRRYFTEIW